jgi:MFS transporter, FSR family, fosmidomycin resistance protein
MTGQPRSPIGTAAILGLAHAAVDFTSLAVLYAEVPERGPASEAVFFALVVAYNCLAFGLQVPLGLIADRRRWYRLFAVGGLAGVIGAVGLCPYHCYAAAVVVALGTAWFHVGAGGMVLAESRGRATEAGIFIAPGAFGLAVGVQTELVGFAGTERWLAVLCLAACALFVIVRPLGEAAPDAIRAGPLGRSGRETAPRESGLLGFLLLGVGLLFLAVVGRSILAGQLTGPWRETPDIYLALAAAAMAGKALGGSLADRLGWRVSSLLALLLLATMITGAAGNALLAMSALLLVQTTTAVTLAAMCVALRRYPATSFGLLSLALLVGAVPGLTGVIAGVDATPLLVPASLLVAVVVLVGLSIVHQRSRGVVP